nr:polysaccharide biosynthesis protein [Shouchella shacheensis]
MQGAKALTIATLLSKILGFIYVVPFTALVGQAGNGLYQVGYVPYTIFISLATLGVPIAMSKFVSKYHAVGDYKTAHRLFQSSFFFMMITGIIAFLLLFSIAPLIAPLIFEENEHAMFTVDDATFVIRMVSIALIVVPVMGIIRGYFQGFHSMVPTAVSQVIEQIVRIAFILLAVYLILNVAGGNLTLAIGFATIGAFVGGIGGLAVLGWYYFKQRPSILAKVESSEVHHKPSLPKMYKELISYALPLSFVGLSIPLFQMIDVSTIDRALTQIGMGDQSEDYLGILTSTVHKIVLIPMALATALSITLVPTITKAYTAGNMKLLQGYITQTYQVILFIGIPSSVGLSVLSEPIFAALYGFENLPLGAQTLAYYGPVTLFFSLYAVTGSILQGMSRQKYAIASLLVGLAIKLALNHVFMVTFGPPGAIWATYLGFGVGIAMNVWAIGKFAQFNYSLVFRRMLLIVMITTVMGLAVWVTGEGLEVVVGSLTRPTSFFITLVGVLVGGVVFFYLTIRSHLAGKVLGEKFKL